MVNDVGTMVPAAWDGRIERVWALCPGHEDDRDRRRGTVYAVPSAEMPDDAPGAAVLRY